MRLKTLISVLTAYAEKHGDNIDAAIDMCHDGKAYQGPICSVAVSTAGMLRIVCHHGAYRNTKLDSIAARIKATGESKICIVPGHQPPKLEMVKEMPSGLLGADGQPILKGET